MAHTPLYYITIVINSLSPVNSKVYLDNKEFIYIYIHIMTE